MANDTAKFLVFSPTSSALFGGKGMFCELYRRTASYAVARFTSYGTTTPDVLYKTLWNDTWASLTDASPSAFAPSGCGYGDGVPYIGAEAGQSYTDKIDALVASWPNMTAKQYATYDANQSTYAMLATIYKYSSQATLVVASSFAGDIATRRKESGVWRDWEWVNPPMQLGVEYRTTERWNGEVGYTKLINCGAMPNASEKIIEHGVSGMKQPLSVSVTAYKSNWAFTLPSSHTNEASVLLNTNGVQITTTIDRSEYTTYALIKYTKS